MDYRELLKKAEEAKEQAYAPYSKFRVGAALLARSGKVYTGCNVENASYGATICAERAAIAKAVSEGEREFEAIAICSDVKGSTFPCGICRQVIAEFGEDIKVVAGHPGGETSVYTISQLMPRAFISSSME